MPAPTNPKLIAFCDPLLAQANGVARPAAADGLPKAVAAFNDSFRERSRLFQWLNAYKGTSRHPARPSRLP